MKRRQAIGALAASPWFAACGGVTVVRPDGDASTLGPAVTRFAISGRLSLRQEVRSDHAGFDWQHAPEADQVLITSPLGQGLARITRDASGARLQRPDQPLVAADSLDDLAQQVFGAQLPLAELAHWVRGARGIAGVVDGWSIRITDFVSQTGRKLPRRLEARWGEIELLMVVSEWSEAI